MRARTGSGRPAWGGPAAIAVDECCGAASVIGGPEPTDLADREAEYLGGLGHLQITPLQGIEDHEPVLRFWYQDDLPHSASRFRPGRGRTFSLTS